MTYWCGVWTGQSMTLNFMLYSKDWKSRHNLEYGHCKFSQSKMIFLGYTILVSININPRKTDAITEMKVPKIGRTEEFSWHGEWAAKVNSLFYRKGQATLQNPIFEKLLSPGQTSKDGIQDVEKSLVFSCAVNVQPKQGHRCLSRCII